MLKWLGAAARRWARDFYPWTNVYGLSRSILALASAATLLANPTAALFRNAVSISEVPICGGLRGGGLFCLLAALHHLEAGRWLAIGILLVVASGWRPRLTGLLHWWVSFSLMANALTVDGGDQATAVITFFLLPVTLTDPRKWHWQAPPEGEAPESRAPARLIALAAFLLIRLQVAMIYFQAGVSKLWIREWGDGTAVYYWLTDPTVGAPPWLLGAVKPLILHPVGVRLLTWSVPALEVVLAAGFFLPSRWRRPLLISGVLFHLCILLVQAITSFAIAMTAALILYLWPPSQPFPLAAARRLLNKRKRALPIRAPLA